MPDATPPDLVSDRSLKLDVSALIVAWIHRGDLRPGVRVSEADVAARLGISRTSGREAVSHLAHEGLIIRKPRSGSVSAQRAQKHLEDIRDARILIERRAAGRACPRITAADTEALRGIIATMAETAVQDHQTVSRIADNRFRGRLWRSLDPLAWLRSPAVLPYKPHASAELVKRHEIVRGRCCPAFRTGPAWRLRRTF